MTLQQEGGFPLSDGRREFKPALVRVEVSADFISSGETLWVTSWWQNTGDSTTERPLRGYMEMVLGHQRTIETVTKTYKVYWDPYPGTHLWKKGEIWKTTCRWNAKPEWCGTFHINVGLCDEYAVPLGILDGSGQVSSGIFIGDVQVGWGYGHPMVELTRKPWTAEFFKPLSVCEGEAGKKIAGIQGEEQHPETCIYGKEMQVKWSEEKPVLLEIGDGLSLFRSVGPAPEALIRQRASDRLLYESQSGVSPQWRIDKTDGDSISYTCRITYLEEFLCCYTLVYQVCGRTVAITLEDVQEADGYELLEVGIPGLLSVEGKGLNLAEFYGGGRLIPVEAVPPLAYAHPYDTRHAAAMYDGHALLVMESSCLDDKMLVAVKENQSGKRADLGIAMVNRVSAKGRMQSIPVQSRHVVEIHLLDRSWGEPSWQAAARFLQRDLKGRNCQLYRRALLHKHLATYGPQPQPDQVKEDSPRAVVQLTRAKKFTRILDEIRQYHNIFDGAPQVAYIGGFQQGGFDASYPYVLDTDPRAGSVEELRSCIREAAKYNAVVGLHDNYDSCVPGPHFDPDIVCTDEEGKPWKGWIWAGGMDYIVSPNKYAASGKMQERVAQTVRLYGLNTSSHIDVLSSELLRYDYDPECPSSADLSLQGKLKIIEEYNKYGIDITSETLQHPFVGHMGYALWLRDNRKDVLFPGEKYIPLTGMVYHGVTGYCGSGGNKTEMLWSLIRGSNYFWEENHTDPVHIQWIYLQNIPLGLLHGRRIRDVEERGDTLKAVYDGREICATDTTDTIDATDETYETCETCATYVMVDFSTQTYEVVVDGYPVARNWTTFVPGFRENSHLAYSLEGGGFSYPLPHGWDADSRLRAAILTLEGEGGELPCEIENGQVRMDIPPRTPVRITCMKACSMEKHY